MHTNTTFILNITGLSWSPLSEEHRPAICPAVQAILLRHDTNLSLRLCRNVLLSGYQSFSDLHLAPESDPGIGFSLKNNPGDEGLVVAHVDAGQVAALRLAGCLSGVPGGRLLHQLVAVVVPGDVAIRAGVLGWGRRLDAAC